MIAQTFSTEDSRQMRLTNLHFEQRIGQPEQWTLGPTEVGNAMLLVGQNASGKSRTLSIIWNFANIIQGKRSAAPGSWVLRFEDGDDILDYRLECAFNIILSERLDINGQNKLVRQSDGTGDIDTLASGVSKKMQFKVPQHTVAVTAKRDLLQHPYMEPLHNWASLVRFYPFGSTLGREGLSVLTKEAPPADPSDWTRTAGVFRRGQKEYPEEFVSKILSYMNRLGYALEDVQFQPAQVEILSSSQPLPGPLFWLTAKEKDLPGWTNQIEMSQGMFRALALMIHLAYAEMATLPSCILLDDVGEGLDYERSTEMIRLLLDIAQGRNCQILMSTNDRFVMNAVPLENWAIVWRQATHCTILNYNNSRDMFDNFRLTGLSNFDLLRSGFFTTQPK